MSDPLRIALIAEGPTDAVVIGAALKSILPAPFVLNALQPEMTRPDLGSGWCGVLKWCREFAKRGAVDLASDPTLAGFDLIIVHADADIAGFNYTEGGAALVDMAVECGFSVLPCPTPCPPASAAADAVRLRVLEWLGLTEPGPRAVCCIPSKAIDSWLAAAILPDEHRLRIGLECNLTLAEQLAQQPLQYRVRKTTRDYRSRAASIAGHWTRIRILCSEAERFEAEVRQKIQIKAQELGTHMAQQ